VTEKYLDNDCVLYKVRNEAEETVEHLSFNTAYHNNMTVLWTKLKFDFSKNKEIADKGA
jgi:hypothetical protein